MGDYEEEIFARLQKKQHLIKIRGSNVFKRTYYLDLKRRLLVFDSTKLSCASSGTGNILPLNEISEVRQGWQTDTFHRMSRSMSKHGPQKGPFREENSFSIIYGDGAYETLDLVASSREQRDDWVRGLKALIRDESETPFDDWLKDMFYEMDADQSGALNFEECCQLLTKMKIEIDRSDALIIFQRALEQKSKTGEKDALDPEEFVNFYHMFNEIPQIFQDLYSQFCEHENRMHISELQAFLHQEQNLNHVDEKTVSRLLQHNEKSFIKNDSYMSIDGFSRMLQSSVFNAYNDYHDNTVHQDMDQPLSNYYISSSHNTFLTGDQVTSNSSIEGYITALKRGCKLVELDLHDNDGSEPYITHGKTLTSKIYLSDVLTGAILPYAFVASAYPLILSIENHMSTTGQRKMVELMTEILQDHILLSTEEGFEQLPSPNQLKNKIIIKAKKPKGMHLAVDSEDSEDSDNEQDTNKHSPTKFKKIKHLVPELNDIVNVCEGIKFESIEKSLKGKCVHFSALNETKALGLLKQSPGMFVELTKHQIVKVYPKGRRLTSSNLKPYPLWAVGTQVVALNKQTNEDKANFYNDGLFRSNGNCGYVLKPNLLTEGYYDPAQLPHNSEFETIVEIRVISGQHLVKRSDVNKVNPYVQVKTRGHDLDKQKFRTKTIEKNGLNPIWEETFTISIKVAPISLIYFKVQDNARLQKDNVLARACIPFNSLTTGYRTVHLLNKEGKAMRLASLFLNIRIIT